LRDGCLALLLGDGNGRQSQAVSEAAALFGEYFGGDSESLGMLMANQPPTLKEQGRILALCSGWPDHSHVTRLFGELPGESVTWEVGLAVVSARIPAEKILTWLEERIHNTPPVMIELLVRHVVRRINRDPDVQGVLRNALRTGTTPGKKATCARLLAAAGRLDLEARDWCDAEIKKQLEGPAAPEMGYDLIAATVRPVVLSLLDALEVSGDDVQSVAAQNPPNAYKFYN